MVRACEWPFVSAILHGCTRVPVTGRPGTRLDSSAVKDLSCFTTVFYNVGFANTRSPARLLDWAMVMSLSPPTPRLRAHLEMSPQPNPAVSPIKVWRDGRAACGVGAGAAFGGKPDARTGTRRLARAPRCPCRRLPICTPHCPHRLVRAPRGPWPGRCAWTSAKATGPVALSRCAPRQARRTVSGVHQVHGLGRSLSFRGTTNLIRSLAYRYTECADGYADVRLAPACARVPTKHVRGLKMNLGAVAH